MPDAWELASIAAKFLLYLGVVLGAGLSFVAIVFQRETDGIRHLIARQSIVFAVLALIASGILFALKGAAMTGDASGMVDIEILGVLWETPIRTELIIRVAGIGLILVGHLIAGFGVWIAGAGGMLTLWSFAWIGHVASYELFWLEMLLAIHLTCVAFWIGILSPLKTVAADREQLSRAADLGNRFGRIAMAAVPILVVSGVVMAWNLLGEVSALVDTDYGLTLLVKIIALGLLLMAAAVNKFRLVPNMRSGDPSAAVKLRRSINVEWLLASIIFLVTAVLTTLTNPPA